jgi:hypothetical protein
MPFISVARLLHEKSTKGCGYESKVIGVQVRRAVGPPRVLGMPQSVTRKFPPFHGKTKLPEG